MALSLPYPSLTFVPLDILTAEEMNQIVANYEFISNQFPIGTGNINNGAITSDKLGAGAVTAGKIGTSAVKNENIDWTSMDTGWVDCPYRNTYSAYTTSTASPGKLQIRIKAGIVYLRGSAQCSGAWAINAEYTIADVPSSISLPNPVIGIGRCSQYGLSWFNILTTGEIVCMGIRGVSGPTTKINWVNISSACSPVD